MVAAYYYFVCSRAELCFEIRTKIRADVLAMKNYSNITSLVSSLLTQSGFPKVSSVRNVSTENSDTHLAVASSGDAVTAVLQDGTEIHLFFKIRRAGSQAEQLDQNFSLFARERMMYEEVLPLLRSFQTPTCQFRVSSMFPRYYGAGLVGGDLYLVLENILVGRAALVTRMGALHTNHQVRLCLHQLGAFHAISRAARQHQGSFKSCVLTLSCYKLLFLYEVGKHEEKFEQL